MHGGEQGPRGPLCGAGGESVEGPASRKRGKWTSRMDPLAFGILACGPGARMRDLTGRGRTPQKDRCLVQCNGNTGAHGR